MRRRQLISVMMVAVMLLLTALPAAAHVPYIERQDYSWLNPFVVQDVEQSKAMYAWLSAGDDIDVYAFEVAAEIDLFVEVIVPVCPAYEQFLPSYAVIGPGLPEPTDELPVELPPGYGAIVVPNLAPGEPRETFYEPFGGKWYYEGVPFSEPISTAGLWLVIAWDPYATGGDYVASIGLEERFTARDILRSLINTPYVRQDRELHTDC